MPKRIQLRRVAGWRKPEGAIVVSRPSKWGNPFTITGAIDIGYCTNETAARRFVVDCFRDWLSRGQMSDWWFIDGRDRYQWMVEHIRDLRGHDLCCWCPLGQPCHADVLLEIANA